MTSSVIYLVTTDRTILLVTVGDIKYKNICSRRNVSSNLHFKHLIDRFSNQGDVAPDSNVLGADMGLIWGRQDPGELHVGPMNFAI